MNKIYIFETRDLDYLNSYVRKAKLLGYQPTIISKSDLENCENYKLFIELYQHLSVGTVTFELSCFARYFALANAVADDESFILSDSDIYLTDRIIDLENESGLKHVFMGSEGFMSSGSEWQISPHFSIWNRELISDFVKFLISSYKRNADDHFLVDHYETQKKRLGRTSISDMTLLYLWINENKVPYINSNSAQNSWGIDHNVSALIGENEVYVSETGRKKIEISDNSGVSFVLGSGQKLEASVVHFQGGYKRILNDFYLKKYLKFSVFSKYIYLGRKIHKITRS